MMPRNPRNRRVDIVLSPELGQDISEIVEIINGLGYTTDEDDFGDDE